MVNAGGGAEANARSQQYAYQANSSLVLAPDGGPYGTQEPTGEAVSLFGRIDPKSFGERAFRGRPAEVGTKLKRKKRQELVDCEAVPKRRRVQGEESILTAEVEGVYKPKTKETKRAYEVLLGVIQQHLGGQPRDVIFGAADEILDTLKDMAGNRDKKEVIERILNCSLPKLVFDNLILLGNLIYDYHDDSGNASDEYNEDVGVTVEFEEEGEESDPDSMSEDGGEEEDGIGGPMQMGSRIGDDMAMGDNKEVTVSVHDIDGYWLQRKISEAFEPQMDAHQRQELAEKVLRDLASEGGDGEVETKLLVHFQCEKFSLVKLLLQNRLRIVWCTRLARARNEEEREQIKEEMLGSGVPELGEILAQLHATRATARERKTNLEGGSIREMSPRLNDGTDNQKLAGKLLDIEKLSFRQGDLLVANRKCDLPLGSFRKREKGYEEIHVPALTAKPLFPGEELVKISDIPEWAQPAFKQMAHLNRVQSKVYERTFLSDDNVLLCAPTGAGKTNAALLTILRQIGLHMNSDGSINHSDYKIVYVAPMKALVAEIVCHLSDRLQHYGVNVKELSGDQSLTCHQIEETQVIVTTPEKWDIITRRSGERTYAQLVRLLILDEIHLLHDNRGPVLESIVARTVRLAERTNEHTRLVGLSTTLPNYDDVARFLHVDISNGLFYFDNSYRPCPLAQQYIGISAKKHQGFHLMNNICYQKVADVAGKQQVLIFVHSRKETVKTARFIRDAAIANDTICRFLKEDCVSREILQSDTKVVKSNDLKEILPYGFAIHHAGMARADRQLIEDLFREGHIQVLVSTATLAWGVNLPAHTVIIKGTRIYNPEKGAWTELGALDVMQMMGRAGRPQYDTYGEGIIITGHGELQYYLSLMNQQLPLESQFVSKLADQLNAEIVLGTVQNAKEASEWLSYTYLYVRMLKNPTLYGLEPDDVARDMSLSERRADLVHSAATVLAKNRLIKYDRRSGYFQVTDLGRIASHYYITHGTISTFNEYLKPTMGDIDLCWLFSLSEEFRYVTVAQDEKMELAKLLDRVPIVIKEGMENPSAKINVLLQAYISRAKLEGLSLMSDMAYITQSAGRILRALFEIILKRGWAQLAEKALNLCKMVNRRMWSVQTPLRQFHKIPNEILLKLEKKSDITWERYYDLSSHELGELVRYPAMGKTLHKFIHQIPKLNLDAHIQPITHTVLRVELTITQDFQWDDMVHGFVQPFWVIIEDNDSEHILHHEYFLLKKPYIVECHIIDFTVPIYEPRPPQYFIRVVSDQWLGSHSILPVSFKHLILPSKNLPPTELLDLQPLPVTSFRNTSYEALYSEVAHFNPVQTQVFSALYHTDENVLVASPDGNGKMICAEFAILRNHQNGHETMRCVYIAPVEALARVRFSYLKEKFGDGLGITVAQLTGETATDLKLLEKGQLIVSTPEKWDALSRRWKHRKHVQKVSLFIVDKLHLIGNRNGHVLEIIVSRMRLISSLVENKTRIVALSTSVANAKDLGEWIGATCHCCFNFSPGVRTMPHEINIQGVDIANLDARRQVMLKQTSNKIVQNALDGKQVLVFVPTMKHARRIALDLMIHSNLKDKENSTEPFVSQVEEDALRKTLKHGIGCLHEGMSDFDQDIVRKLFQTGWVQVCVMSCTMCWGFSLSAPLVVVMGTQYDDGLENSQSDYPVVDLLQMVGHSSSKCVIFTHTPRKEYYKKFLNEAISVESHLQHFLHNHLNSEVAAGVIENKQQAVGYLTWTFMYRRLTQNPNYYNLTGVSHRYISEHLSELVETTVSDLGSSQCVNIEDNDKLSSSDLGMIASYYYISYTTIERFRSSLTSKTKMKGLLGILASASEFAHLPTRQGEEELLRKLINHQRFSFGEIPKYSDPHMKANALLQAHFSRQTIGGYLVFDQKEVLVYANRLVWAMVDVISSKGLLSLALTAMELSQMLAQGMWERDPILLQIPHFTRNLAGKCRESGIETVFDLMEMEDGERRKLLQMSDVELVDITKYFEKYPSIDLSFNVVGDEIVEVTLERELNEGCEVALNEGWWLLVGDSESDKLLSIKKSTFLQGKATVTVKLELGAPLECGKNYKLYFMSFIHGL